MLVSQCNPKSKLSQTEYYWEKITTMIINIYGDEIFWHFCTYMVFGLIFTYQ